MRIESSFEVPAAPAQAWALLMDVPRVVPCMPGAELVETVDESNWKANMKVKMGPMAFTFATDVCREEADEQAGRVLLSAKAREVRGRGGAHATIESTLAAADGGTTIGVVTDLALSGAVARYGRGIVQDVTEQLVTQFAEGLRRQLADPSVVATATAAQPPTATQPPNVSRPAGESGRSVMQRSVSLLLHYPRAGAAAADIPGVEAIDAPGAELLRRLLEITVRSPDITTGQLIEAFRDDPDGRWIERLARDEPLDDEAAAPAVLRDSLKRLVERHRRKAEVEALRSRRGPPAGP